MRIGLGQLAAAFQANPDAGTYDDINCPTSCFVLGNVLDMTVLGQECWPCHNVCPAGTVWDTTNLVCSATPATVNSVAPVTQNSAPPPPPVDCSSIWSQITNSQCDMSTGVYVAAGVAIVALIAMAVIIGGRR